MLNNVTYSTSQKININKNNQKQQNPISFGFNNHQTAVSSKFSAWNTNLMPMVLPNFKTAPTRNEVSVQYMNSTAPALMTAYAPAVQSAAVELNSRAGKKGQFLNWINVLPNEQLKNIDKIYDKAAQAKKHNFKNLVVIGIGGSRHTNEAMSKMLNRDKNLHFYSGIDDISFNRFMKKIDPKDTMFLVVSKSGKTIETLNAYKKTKALMEGLVGKEEAKKHFATMTDADPSKSKLRQEVNKGDIPISGLVHDDVGGRFSIFDDATFFTLAYQGLPKNEAKALLKGSLEGQKEGLNPDITKNKAAQQAVFNVEAKRNGKSIHFVQYFGDYFKGAQFWEKQRRNESLKDSFYTDSNVGPAYLHYNAESDLSPGNRDSAFTIVNVKPEADKLLKAALKGVLKAYSAQHPVSHIQLDNLKP